MIGDYSPSAIRGVFKRTAELAPELDLVLSGILGDADHYAEGGYHVPRRSCPSGDYSCQLADDRMGDPAAASALDLKPSNTAGMAILTRRLIKAVERQDPRIMKCVREFYGTLDGRNVTGRDVRTGRVVLSDDSHLWHLHISFIRRYATDPEALAGVAEVLAGVDPANPNLLEYIVSLDLNSAEYKAFRADLVQHVWTDKIGSANAWTFLTGALGAAQSAEKRAATVQAMVAKLPTAAVSVAVDALAVADAVVGKMKSLAWKMSA